MQRDEQPSFTDYTIQDGARQLPTYEGFTIDTELMEFRWLEPEESPECVPFGSEDGVRLLNRLLEHLVTKHPKSELLEEFTEFGYLYGRGGVSPFPREPNWIELRQLQIWLVHQYPQFDMADAWRYMEDLAYIAVFDNYITDAPGYSGKVMIVVWERSPRECDVYIWDEYGRLKQMKP